MRAHPIFRLQFGYDTLFFLEGVRNPPNKRGLFIDFIGPCIVCNIDWRCFFHVGKGHPCDGVIHPFNTELPALSRFMTVPFATFIDDERVVFGTRRRYSSSDGNLCVTKGRRSVFIADQERGVRNVDAKRVGIVVREGRVGNQS